MRYNTVEIMDRGMACLVEKLGIVEAEHFISVILRESFDYTKWHHGGKIPFDPSIIIFDYG